MADHIKQYLMHTNLQFVEWISVLSPLMVECRYFFDQNVEKWRSSNIFLKNRPFTPASIQNTSYTNEVNILHFYFFYAC